MVQNSSGRDADESAVIAKRENSSRPLCVEEVCIVE